MGLRGQGSGKGTLSARLVQKYDLHFVSTGDVLRREIMNKTKVGKEAEAIVASGGTSNTSDTDNRLIMSWVGLISDELMLEIVQTELDKLKGKVRPPPHPPSLIRIL
jgi:adenylate kinase family enzyme